MADTTARRTLGGFPFSTVPMEPDEEDIASTYCSRGEFPWRVGELHLTNLRFIWTPFHGVAPIGWRAPIILDRAGILDVVSDDTGANLFFLPSKWRIETNARGYLFSFRWRNRAKRAEWLTRIKQWANISN